MKFEPYYDKCMKQWSVRDTETFVMYPCTSENMANEFTKLLNELHEENKELKNIIKCLENGSCRSIDSFLDDYCSDKLLKEYDLID